MADSSLVALSRAYESGGYGLPTDLSAVAFTKMRFTAESLQANTNVAVSNEIRGDRQRAFVARVGLAAGGDIDFELSYGAFDEELMAMLQVGAWSTPITVTASTISASSVDNSLNGSGGSEFDTIVAGRWVKVSGFTGAGITANAGVFKVVSKPTNAKIILGGGALVTDAAGESVTVYQPGTIENSTTLRTYAIQRIYGSDVPSDVGALFRGMCFDKLSLSIPRDNIVTGKFGLIGKNEATITSVQGSGVSENVQNDVLTGVDNVPVVWEGTGAGTGMGTYGITEGTLEMANNLRTRLQVGTLGAVSIGSGTIDLTGTLNAYFANATVMNKYLNWTTSGVAFKLVDSAGNILVIEMPRVKYTNGRRVAGGINTDIIAAMDWTAFRHPTEDVTIRISRFPIA